MKKYSINSVNQMLIGGGQNRLNPYKIRTYKNKTIDKYKQQEMIYFNGR